MQDLTHNELEMLAGWFTARMPMEQRHELMAELPVLYARLFPGVAPTVVLNEVQRTLDDEARQRRETRQLDAGLVAHQHCDEV